MDVRQKAHPLLVILLGLQRNFKKNYSYPAQKKILSLIRLILGYHKSTATLNRWMRVSEDAKYLIRKRRIKRHPVHGIVFKSTLYKITIKGLRLLSASGVDVKKEIAAFNAWIKEISPRQNKEPGGPPLRSADTKRLNQILSELGANFIT